MSAYYNEYDPVAAAWLRELIKRGLIADGIVDERSIIDVAPEDLKGFTQCHFFAGIGGWSYALRLAGWPDDKPVWTGSPPCQPFSTAGQQKGKDDERHLAPHFAALVAAGRPDILFGEQVASAAVFGKPPRRSVAAPDAEPQWAWIDDLFGRLEAAHYACGAADLPAAGVGAPHIRQRTFFGAVRLADAPGGREWSRQCEQDGDTGQHRASGGAGGLADADDTGPQGYWRFGKFDGPQGWEDAKRHSAEVGLVVGLADAEGAGSPHGGSGAIQPILASGDKAGTGGVADADSAGRSAWKWHDQAAGHWHPSATEGVDGGMADRERPSPSDGQWRDADWLFCRDGKWRAVEPGTFPLAHGLPSRVGRLRGYGNAIVPQAAAAFVTAFIQALEDIR